MHIQKYIFVVDSSFQLKMQFLIVSLAFLGMTSGAVVYTNGYYPTVYANSAFPLVYADTVAVAPVPVATVPISPEAQAVGDSIKCNLKALSESACKLAEGINCKASFISENGVKT